MPQAVPAPSAEPGFIALKTLNRHRGRNFIGVSLSSDKSFDRVGALMKDRQI
jgi:hypothetical protein